MAPFRTLACLMTVMAAMTERFFNLVVPLAQKATAMRITDTTGSRRVRSGAVSLLKIRQGDVDSTKLRFGL